MGHLPLGPLWREMDNWDRCAIGLIYVKKKAIITSISNSGYFNKNGFEIDPLC